MPLLFKAVFINLENRMKLEKGWKIRALYLITVGYVLQAYKINGEKAVHLNPRPQQKDAKSSKTKGGGTCCEACGRHIQDLPNRFCSIACKVSLSLIDIFARTHIHTHVLIGCVM